MALSITWNSYDEWHLGKTSKKWEITQESTKNVISPENGPGFEFNRTQYLNISLNVL